MSEESVFEWLKIFDSVKCENVLIYRAFAYLSDGIRRYAEPVNCRAVKIAQEFTSDAGNSVELVLLLEGADPPAAPGDRITFRGHAFELKNIRECQTVEGEVLARRCTLVR